MAREHNRLSTLKVKTVKEPGMYADGGGLYLRVAEGGSKGWIFRYVTNGRMRDMGLGACHTITLAEARDAATEARKLRLKNIDPIEHKRAQRGAAAAASANAMTFRQCAEGFIKDNEAKWTNARHRKQWDETLTKYVYPILGELPVAIIDTPLVLKVIKPIWTQVPETASRVCNRIARVLGWATVHHYRTGDNPARWQGHLENALPARSEIAKVEHHAALPYVHAPAFMAKLRKETSVTARCLEFIALTVARLGEAQYGCWSEIDFEARTWTIPAERMKSGREHKVPLSDATIAVLKDMAATRQSDYIFPGHKDGRPLGRDAVWKLARNTHAGITVHGLRSTFRDWAAECTSFDNHVVEMALAHAIPSAVEAAYRRGDLFVKRLALMQQWADYCAGSTVADNVVPIRA